MTNTEYANGIDLYIEAEEIREEIEFRRGMINGYPDYVWIDTPEIEKLEERLDEIRWAK